MVTVDIIFQLGVLYGMICTGWALTIQSSVHCAVRREISPCTCQYQEYSFRKARQVIKVTCEGMTSFGQVLTALQNKFETDVDISLKISYSTLEDLPLLSFQHLGLTIYKLELNYDNLRSLHQPVFDGLGKVEFLSLSDNAISVIPQGVLKQMSRIRTLDLGGGRIENISSSDFTGLPLLRHLLLPGNNISLIEVKSLPSTLTHLQLGGNRIKNLNGTIRSLNELEWLVLNRNNLESLDGELPEQRPNKKLKLLLVNNNYLSKPPQELRHFYALDKLDLAYNKITSLHNALSSSEKLKTLILTFNNISLLAENEFLGLKWLEDLQIGFNNLKSLNGSLLPLKSLKNLNLTYNNLKEFSLQDIRGLTKLILVDLSHNSIHELSGRMKNLVELETRVFELRLEYNKLQTLSGSLMGLSGLRRLNLSHNCIESISPEDLIGLDDLKILDISHNHLVTLEETSKTVLPSLEELIASHNWVTNLEKDFHGLQRLCWADLSHNKIETISTQLADKTQCQLHGVNSTLRIYLQGNPVLCKPDTENVIRIMESKNNTKIHGETECHLLNNITSVAQVP